MSQPLTTARSPRPTAPAEAFDRATMMVLLGVGIAIGVAVPALAYFLLAGTVPAIGAAGDRLAFALPWMGLPLLALMAGVGMVSMTRLPTEYADGSPPPSGTRLDMHRRYVQNTVEQIAIFVPTQLALATLLPEDRLALIPAWAALFLVARLTFWVGYVRNPAYRSLGFSMTAPGMFAVVYVLYRAVA